jgi:low affinity Fe/Cu permease
MRQQHPTHDRRIRAPHGPHRAAAPIEAGATAAIDRLFQRFAHQASTTAGSSWAFALAAFTVLAWAISGPVFGFSETWQLVINTGTTIVTFLMVFLVQNSQNRDTKAIHLKLDELLRAHEGARDGQFVDLEDRTDRELDEVKEQMLMACSPGESAEEHARHSPLRLHRRQRPRSSTTGANGHA